MRAVSSSPCVIFSRLKFPLILQRTGDGFEKLGLDKIAKTRYRDTGGRFFPPFLPPVSIPVVFPLIPGYNTVLYLTLMLSAASSARW